MVYLLDTDTCIFFLRGKYGIDQKIEGAGQHNCFISEITLAELKFGAENSAAPDKHRAIVKGLEQNFSIIPIFSALDVYGQEKARLNKAGTPLDDFTCSSAPLPLSIP